jgi:hypothetical protein
VTREVMSRKRCKRCDGETQYQLTNDQGYTRWITCQCTEPGNPAGEGYEVEWIEIEVTEVTR